MNNKVDLIVIEQGIFSGKSLVTLQAFPPINTIYLENVNNVSRSQTQRI